MAEAGKVRRVEYHPGLIVFEPHPDPARIVPSRPLGPWALRALKEMLEASDRGRPVILDLTHAPVSSPGQVASILWVDDAARDLGVRLEIFTPDMASAELLDFAGVEAPVFAGAEHHPAGAGRARRRRQPPRLRLLAHRRALGGLRAVGARAACASWASAGRARPRASR